MLSRVAIVGFVLLALAAGCSVESGRSSGRRTPASDGGFVDNPPGNGEGGRPTLTIVGDTVLPLSFAESVELVVMFENAEGEPYSGQSIAFDMVGQPEDSSLSEVTVRTDGEGKARVTLRAATRPVAFEVQASNTRARPVSFSVSVNGNGFGSLQVHAPYDGVRAVDERFLFALPNVSCDAADYAAGVRKTVFPPAEDSASLIALPAGLPYAIVAIAESASGQAVARGCTDMIVVTEQGEDEVGVTFVDQPLEPDEVLDLIITLEAGSAAASLGAAMRRSVGELVRASGKSAPRDAEGAFWLDALQAALREDGDDAQLELADALQVARLDPAGGSPESDLTRLLQRNDEGAESVVSTMAALVREALDTIELHAGIGYERGRTPLLEITSLRIEALSVFEGGQAPRVVLDETKGSIAAALVPGEDVLHVTELQLAPGLGSLGADALDSALDASVEELGIDLLLTAGCSSLGEWYGEQTYVDAEACDAACIARACAYAFDQITTAAGDALNAEDEERPLATLNGSLSLTDSDGDLHAEKMEAERIEGSWAPAPDASLGDTLRGTAVANAP
jgi:hypothetical protein